MLTASTERDFGVAMFSARLAVERDFLVHVVRRRGLFHDTRWFPVVRAPARDVTVHWVVLRGGVELGGERPSAPFVLSLSERDYHGADGRRYVHYRTHGHAFDAIEVRVRGTHHDVPRFRALRDDGLATALALARALDTGAEAADVTSTLDRLVRAVDPSSRVLLRPPSAPDPRVLVWRAFEHVYRRLDTSTSMKHLAALASELASERRIERELGGLLTSYLFPAPSWRDITTYTRLGLATFLLSCEALPVASVAKEVGYGHTAALTNAFARAGLPPPSAIRARLYESARADG